MSLDIRNMVLFWGKALLLFSFAFWPPAIIAHTEQTGNAVVFLNAGLIGLVFGGVLVLVGRMYSGRVSGMQGVIEVFLLWHILGLFAALPFWQIGGFDHFIDCVYEALSGITTTGIELATLSNWTPDLLFYHQELQFLGGLGIIVFVLAIFPERFQSASQLFNVDITGPQNSKRIVARVGATSRIFTLLYLALTLLCMGGFYLSGLDLFSSICETFGIISTGGFSIHPDGLAFYQSKSILYIASFVMLLSSISFKCHYLVFIKGVFRHYWHDQESRYYLMIVISLTSMIYFGTLLKDESGTFLPMFFSFMSLVSTTGTTFDVSIWSGAMLFLLTVIGAVGGCSGSTSGGIKIARLYYIMAQAKRGLYNFINRRQVTGYDDPGLINLSLQGFGALMLATYLFFAWLLMLCGLDYAEAFQLTYSSVSCVGAMLMSAVDMKALTLESKWISMEAMIAGRMELIAFWVIFTPRFCRN